MDQPLSTGTGGFQIPLYYSASGWNLEQK